MSRGRALKALGRSHGSSHRTTQSAGCVLVSACSRVCAHLRASARVCVVPSTSAWVRLQVLVSPSKCLCRCWERAR